MPTKKLTDEQRKLVEDHYGLAWHFILVRWKLRTWWKRFYDDAEDAFQTAVIGVIEAAIRYDPKLAKFSTYAYYWMRQQVANEAHQRRLIYIPENEDRNNDNYPHVTTNHMAVYGVGRDYGEGYGSGIIDEALSRDETDIDNVLDCQDAVADVLKWIPKVRRNIFMAHFGYGVPGAEIARNAGLSRERIRNILDEEMHRVLIRLGMKPTKKTKLECFTDKNGWKRTAKRFIGKTKLPHDRNILPATEDNIKEILACQY